MAERREFERNAKNIERKEHYKSLSDASLLDALGRDDAAAFLEIVERYQGLVFRYAGYLGIDRSEQREWVNDLIHDVVLSLLKRGAIMPTSLGSYFATACRNKAFAAHRARMRRQVREEAAADYTATDGSVVESLCSEDMIRNARGPDWEVSNLSPVLSRLAREFEKILTHDERQLLDWSSESVPLRVIADWSGITRTAAAHRVSRLKHRLKQLSQEIIDRFSSAERSEIEKFLRRSKDMENQRND